VLLGIVLLGLCCWDCAAGIVLLGLRQPSVISIAPHRRRDRPLALQTSRRHHGAIAALTGFATDNKQYRHRHGMHGLASLRSPQQYTLDNDPY
jgi:hypothetical protein